MLVIYFVFVFSSRRRHTSCALVTGVQTCALPICGLYLSDDDLGRVQRRMADEPELCVLGLRFTGDKLVPRKRFEHLREALGDRFVAVEIDSSRGNPHGIPAIAHSVLTEHLVDEPGHPTRDALEQVLDLFPSKPMAASTPGGVVRRYPRAEGRRVGQGVVRPVRSRGSP